MQFDMVDLKQAERNQPFLLIIGKLENMKEASLIIDKKKFSKMRDDITVVKALLLLYAGYFILNLDYHSSAKAFYQCLEHHLFGTCAKPKSKEYIALFK